MPDFFITYDLQDQDPDPHKPFLTAAQKVGLLYVWTGLNYVSRLPNTTVWGVFNNLAEANTAFEKALAATTVTVSHPIKLEKRATIQASATQVLSDKRKKPEAKWTGKSSYETSDLHQINDPFFK